MSTCFNLETPIGWLVGRMDGEALVRLDFQADVHTLPAAPEGDVAQYVTDQLEGYFTDPHIAFDLPFMLAGTPFQMQVWAALRRIPAGEVRTYGEIARIVGSSPRAVGNACRHNPLPLVVPCHRVVSAGGIGGFAGARSGTLLGIKRWLLNHEGIAL